MTADLPSRAPLSLALDAFVTAALFPAEGAAFALGDGTVWFESGERVAAHDGAVLCACLHPSGSGVLTGGDDGRVAWSRPSGVTEIASAAGRWIEAVAASSASGLIAFAAGREVQVRDVGDPRLAHAFAHERTVAALAFEPKGRRLAAATYGGLRLWYGRIVEQKPAALNWAGSHIGVAWSPDGKFLVSSMQENALHGWRLADGKDMRMGGYPAKVRGMAFLAKGGLMATSGAEGAVVWPFVGAAGPMGREAREVGPVAGARVTAVAAHQKGRRVCAGLDDGRVWTADVDGGTVEWLGSEGAAPITALAVSPEGTRVAWGDEAGGAGVTSLLA